jgi:accessory gene regulator protein AgrB
VRLVIDLPWYLWALVLILLAPWLVNGLIYIGVFLFAVFASSAVGVLTILEHLERRYNRSRLVQWRRERRRQKRIARAKARGPRR